MLRTADNRAGKNDRWMASLPRLLGRDVFYDLLHRNRLTQIHRARDTTETGRNLQVLVIRVPHGHNLVDSRRRLKGVVVTQGVYSPSRIR